jgi:hypothetical protein
MSEMDSGPNFAAMQSMMQHNKAASGAVDGAIPSNGAAIASSITTGNLDENLGKQISGAIDVNFAGPGLEGASSMFNQGAFLTRDFLADIGDGSLVGPGNISHGGAEFATSAMGNVEAGGAFGVASNTNAKIPVLHSGAGQGAGH